MAFLSYFIKKMKKMIFLNMLNICTKIYAFFSSFNVSGYVGILRGVLGV